MKHFKHWLIQKLLKWGKILDIEKALRDKYHEGVMATEKKYEGRINVWWDPTVRSYPQPRKIVNPRGNYFMARHLEFMPPPVDLVLPVIRTNTAPDDPFPDWLTSGPLSIEHMTPDQIAAVPTIRDLTPAFDPDDTNEVPAIMKLYYQERQARHAG